jgi:hypothetical protein
LRYWRYERGYVKPNVTSNEILSQSTCDLRTMSDGGRMGGLTSVLLQEPRAGEGVCLARQSKARTFELIYYRSSIGTRREHVTPRKKPRAYVLTTPFFIELVLAVTSTTSLIDSHETCPNRTISSSPRIQNTKYRQHSNHTGHASSSLFL